MTRAARRTMKMMMNLLPSTRRLEFGSGSVRKRSKRSRKSGIESLRTALAMKMTKIKTFLASKTAVTTKKTAVSVTKTW